MPLPDLLSAVGALALVLGLIVLLRFGSRYFKPGRLRDHGTPMVLVGHLALDARRRMTLVQCGTGQVLLLTGGTTDMMLAWPQPPAGESR